MHVPVFQKAFKVHIQADTLAKKRIFYVQPPAKTKNHSDSQLSVEKQMPSDRSFLLLFITCAWMVHILQEMLSEYIQLNSCFFMYISKSLLIIAKTAASPLKHIICKTNKHIYA